VIPARYAAVAGVCAFCSSAAGDAGLSEHAAFHVQMAVDEACTNIIEHAYGDEGRGEISVLCRVEPGQLTIVLRDQGEPFDPTTVPLPKLGMLLDDTEVGGLGLYFMRQVMDEVRFRFDAEGNELTMVKRGASAVRTSVAPTGAWLIQAAGRLDAAAVPELEKAFREAIAREAPSIVVDLGEASYISSSGLKTIVSTWRVLRARGGDLVLAALGPRLLEIFEMVGFTQILKIYPTANEALGALAERCAE